MSIWMLLSELKRTELLALASMYTGQLDRSTVDLVS